MSRTSPSIIRRLAQFKQTMDEKRTLSLGYPVNSRYDYRALFPFFNYSLNNLGDPYVESNYQITTRPFEREVISFFARLYRLPRMDTWGYVTSGGTEGNMYGIFAGRELFPEGVLYFSADSHYSISKISRILRLPPVVVRSQRNGEMHYQDLERQLDAHRGRPPIFNINIGTTMKGAIDRVDTITAILKKKRIKKYYLHCDCALFGMMLPFLPGSPRPDFSKQPIDSLAISGYKFIGSPVPCGVVIARKRHVHCIVKKAEYIGSLDTTLAGSRSGHAPLILWYAIHTRGRAGFAREARTNDANARYLSARLREHGYFVLHNPFSNIVVFSRPPSAHVHRWQLAVSGDFAHIDVMQHVTRPLIDRFLKDFIRAFPRPPAAQKKNRKIPPAIRRPKFSSGS